MGSRQKREREASGMVWRDGRLIPKEEAARLPTRAQRKRGIYNPALINVAPHEHVCIYNVVGDKKTLDGVEKVWLCCAVCKEGEWYEIEKLIAGMVTPKGLIIIPNKKETE